MASTLDASSSTPWHGGTGCVAVGRSEIWAIVGQRPGFLQVWRPLEQSRHSRRLLFSRSRVRHPGGGGAQGL